MTTLKDQIIGLTFGIRFKKSFRIPEISGNLVDNILYSEGSPFGTDFFPKLEERSNREKTLYNPVSSEYLRINTDDLILGLVIDKNFSERFKWLKEEVLSYFQNTLFREHKIKNIIRLGIVFHHRIVESKKMVELVKTFTDNVVPEIDNINISFSRKTSTTDALVKKEVMDFKNQIYTFQKVDEVMFADLDYQYWYEPAVEDLRECNSEKILDEAQNFLETNFHQWLAKYEKS